MDGGWEVRCFTVIVRDYIQVRGGGWDEPGGNELEPETSVSTHLSLMWTHMVTYRIVHWYISIYWLVHTHIFPCFVI